MFVRLRRLVLLLCLYSGSAFAQSNNLCANAITLTSGTTCTSTSGSLTAATTFTNIGGSCGNRRNDVWFRFRAQSATSTITITTPPANTAFQVYTAASCGGTAVSVVCVTGATGTVTGLSVGTDYLIRVYSTSNATGNFSICVTHPVPPPPPANDNCADAVLLSVGATATSGSLVSATASTGIAACAGNADDDVWYQFVAAAPNANITASYPAGSLLSNANMQMQLLSGTCTALSNVACGLGSISASNLVPGTTYYLRVFGSGTGPVGSTSSQSAFSISVSVPAVLPSGVVVAGRQNEVFQLTTLSAANLLADPWEITYGSDNMLWITEAKGYKLHRMNPSTGVSTTVLNVSQGSTFLPLADQGFNVQFAGTQSPWPQGGFAGMALHPQFMDPVNPKNFVYVSYVHSYQGLLNGAGNGQFFTNRVVRFTYNTATGRCESPVSLCDTLPGSNDHNSQRMIIAPVNGTPFLFYASGDMGSGQFDNANRPIKSLINASYEGKILRFNLEPDGDAGTLDRWIPNDNPFNGTRQSAVWSTGIRNNQGFAFANINGTDYLFGSSHGPFSDDEINIIERARNYGHPNVIGFAADNNYNNVKAGTATGSMPLIVNEAANATALGTNYRDPIFSAYAAPNSTIVSIYGNQTNNGAWPSEGWSGMDIYTNSVIPGWKNSLLVSSLKWGRVLRLKLNTAGNGIVATGGQDTVGHFGSRNRFRDVALGPDGRDLFVIMDRSSTTSGPTASNPVVSACAGCVQKYTFLGYQSNTAGKSMIPTAVNISTGTAGSCITASTANINSANNNLWVPITGPDGNILAEIRANGNNLGTVTAAVYYHGGAIRQTSSGNLYGNRSLTITPQVQPSSPVSIRLYLTAAELNALMAGVNSAGTSAGINSVADLVILKNNDPCAAALSGTVTVVQPMFADAHANGFVLQANINSFSSFYFGGAQMTLLPLQLVTFESAWKEATVQLKWSTTEEMNTRDFLVERSTTGKDFSVIGTTPAKGSGDHTYGFTDVEAGMVNSKKLYYRLRMVDQDNSFTYSNVISLPVQASRGIVVYPNPVEHTLNLRIAAPQSEDCRVIIRDVEGRLVFNDKLPAGNTSLQVGVRNWKPQVYLIHLLNSRGKVLVAQKFLKL